MIGATVAALAGQDYAAGGTRRFDVLVVDDGSADGTGDLARGGCARDRTSCGSCDGSPETARA